MNKSEVCNSPGWTVGRVDHFLIVEHFYLRYGLHDGRYTEYEYSPTQILDAENSIEWRKAAARYLKVSADDLDATIARLSAEREARRIDAETYAASFSAEFRAKRESKEAQRQRLIANARGGLFRKGCTIYSRTAGAHTGARRSGNT